MESKNRKKLIPVKSKTKRTIFLCKLQNSMFTGRFTIILRGVEQRIYSPKFSGGFEKKKRKSVKIGSYILLLNPFAIAACKHV